MCVRSVGGSGVIGPFTASFKVNATVNARVNIHAMRAASHINHSVASAVSLWLVIAAGKFIGWLSSLIKAGGYGYKQAQEKMPLPELEVEMSVAKSLWASVQGDPVFMRRVNGWLTIFWVAMIPISMAMGWLNSVVYVSALSLWALVSGHWSAWQAARVEVKQEEAQKAAEQQDVASEVVQALVEKTTIEPQTA